MSLRGGRDASRMKEVLALYNQSGEPNSAPPEAVAAPEVKQEEEEATAAEAKASCLGEPEPVPAEVSG